MGLASTAKKPAERRRLRNLLIDRRFQLKYACLFGALAAVLSGGLGYLLWSTSESLIAQSREAVTQGEQVVSLGRKVASESRSVSEVVRMNIVKDPVYGDSPELLRAFRSDSDRHDSALAAQQRALEAQANSLGEQSIRIEEQQRAMLWSLFAGLAVLVLGVLAIGILVTHRVAGPVYKMTRQMRTIASGRLRAPEPLRKGDDLGDFFGSFARMVDSLRHDRQAHVDRLAAIAARLEGEDRGAAAAELEELRRKLAATLAG